MPTLTIAVAAVAAVVMAVATTVILRRTAPSSLVISLGCGALAVLVSALLARGIGGTTVPIAAVVATGSAPVAALILGLLTREERARSAPVIAVALWAAVVVPVAIVVPQALASTCPPQSCVVDDFAGGLPYLIGVGAFVIVLSAAVPTLRRSSPAGRVGASAVLVIVVWAAFVVWLAALELDIDRYTPRIALAAVISPVCAAIGWALTDRIRGLNASIGRGLSLGLVTGMVALLPSVGSIATPWAALVGAVAGIAGALAHDARALRFSPPTTRVAVAALVVGTIAMIIPGILGTTLGFVFAARIDVLGTQLLAVLGVMVVAVAVSVPAAVLLRRRAPG